MSGRGDDLATVGGSERRIDGVRLATGRATFADDLVLPGLLHASILRSPRAHARIKAIDARAARGLAGVAMVLTHEDVPRRRYSSIPTWDEGPHPEDATVLDDIVRFVGDRVAVVAAEDPEIAVRACEAITVDYEALPPVLDTETALAPGAPLVHHHTSSNVAAVVEASAGDVEKGLAEAERVFEGTYRSGGPRTTGVESYVSIAWLDEDGRLVVRTSSDVPFHVRRTVARLLDLPAGRIRVLTPPSAGGRRSEILGEDVTALLTLRTGRPVRLAYTRGEEMTAGPAHHPQAVTIRTGLRDGRFTAIDVRVVENAGAHAGSARAGLTASGSHVFSLYRSPHCRYEARAVYTNRPPAASRGQATAEVAFALESHLDEVAVALGLDPLELRQRNRLQDEDAVPILRSLDGTEAPGGTSGIAEVLDAGAAAIDWLRRRRRSPASLGPRLRGVGVALAPQSGGAGRHRGVASIRMNEDGSFNLLVGTRAGTTTLCQIAAEALGVPSAHVVPAAWDTDVPLLESASPSSSTHASGSAVQKAADGVRAQILEVAARMLDQRPSSLTVREGRVVAEDGRDVTYADVCLRALREGDGGGIHATASHVVGQAAASFAAAFAEVEVDVETGVVSVLRLVEAVDCGRVLNPRIAEGHVQGAAIHALAYALVEEAPVDAEGRPAFSSLREPALPRATDVPEVVAVFVGAHDPTGPYGAKSLGDLPLLAPAPAIANAVAHAVGVRLRELPLTPERVLAAITAARGDV